MKSLSRVQLFVTPWTVAYQTPPSMGFPRQEYWSGLPFPSSEDLPNPGIEPGSPTLYADALLSELPGNLDHKRSPYILLFSNTFCFLCALPSFISKRITAAAAAAKSLQLCPTLCDPLDGNPPGSPIPGILQARTLEWVAISFSTA